MKVLVVSDTHGRHSKLEEAVQKETPFSYLIHGGDVEGGELSILSISRCPCTIVAGNNDFFTRLPKEAQISLEGQSIFVVHGHQYGISGGTVGIEAACRARACRIAIFGHTHRPLIQERDGVLLINPGSLSLPRQEGRRPSYVVLELSRDQAPHAEIRYL